VVATSGGQIARYRPGDGETDYLADGFDQLYGVAIGPGDTIVFAELGTGRVHSLRSGNVEVLASGLRDPVGVAFDPNGNPLVSESGAGRVVRLAGASESSETVVDGLQRPQGIVVSDGQLYIVDAGAKEVIAFDLNTGDRRTIASGLPVGAPPGVEPKPLKGMPPFSGPQGPFAGITIAPDGTLYVSADSDGSVLALRRA
jgi:sugar lactone lactonase YvrE